MEDNNSLQPFPEERMRLILIGKTGAGKSATGNTILGAELFRSHIGLNSETKECGMAITKRDGQEILVMDTPGFCDTFGDDEMIAQMITQSLFAVAPGPHAVILVMRCDARFTDQEVKVFNMLKEVFGPKMTSYLIVIFVGKDELDRRNVNFEAQLAKSVKLQGVLREADNRYLLFNNEGDVHEKALMVGSLMQMVRDVVASNGGGCFRHRISRKLDETMARMVREEIRERTGESLPVISEEEEYSTPKPPSSTPAKHIPSYENVKLGDEAGRVSAEDGLSHADQQAINRKQEVHELHGREMVKARLQQFSKPEPEKNEKRGVERRPGQAKKLTSLEAPKTGPPPSPQAPQENPAHSDVVCHWKSDDTHVEEVLDQLQDQLVRELRTTDDAAFVYQVPDKPGMTFAEKQRLVEDALKKKIVSHPEELDEAQKKEMDKAVKSVGQKIKEGMTKFAVKAIDQCRVM